MMKLLAISWSSFTIIWSRVESKAVALKNAQAATRDNPDHPEWQHPFYWAAFVLNGDPGIYTDTIPQGEQEPDAPSLLTPLLWAVIITGGILVFVVLLVVSIRKKRANEL